MYYVYLIRSIAFFKQIYTGFTSNLKERIKAHNAGKSVHTAKYKPYELEVYLGFKSKQKAIDFEKYLKSGSGRAFAKKRFW